ncbi:MAG: hypothetical protein R6X12_04080, partial [bacterium]
MRALLMAVFLTGVLPAGPLVLDSADLARSRLFPDLAALHAIVPETFDSAPVVDLLLAGGEVIRIPVTGNEVVIIRALAAEPLPGSTALDNFWLRMRLRARAPRDPLHEHRLFWTNRGAWLGAGAGGCAAANTAVHYVGETGGCVNTSMWRIDFPTYWLISCGATGLGAGAGCLAGGREDRRPAALSFPESHGHRADWTVGGALLGGIAGYTFFLLAGPTLFGRIEWVDRVVND